jgi:hypothetical protein
MDPNLFHLDWERVTEVLVTIVVLSFVIERALAVLFEHKAFIKRFDGKGVKEVIAVAVSIAVTIGWRFDAISMIVLTDRTTILGELLTGCVIAGGSKASLKLFHDVLDVRSSAHEAVHPIDPATHKPDPIVHPAALAQL